jgi:membrane-associated progesterone receptor component
MESVNATLALIPQYTGLSVGTFFTILALVVGIYYLISGLFAPAPVKYVPVEPLPPPTQLGEITADELQQYDGTDPSKPLLMAIKGQIYDVSQSKAFYGPGGPYALFAGKDASRALAKMSFEEKDLTGDIEGLSAYEAEALTDWEYKFMSKYVKVGTVKPGPVSNKVEESAEKEEADADAAPDAEPEASKDE